MPASDRAIRRIRKELKLLWIDPPAFCRPGPAPVKDPFHWEVVIDGPDGSPYAGGTFPVGVAYPKDYPFKPKTKVYHPNIGPEGRMAVDIFGSEWRPSLTISTALLSVVSVLYDPLLDLPVRRDAARLYKRERGLFEQKARDWTRRFRTGKTCRLGVGERRQSASCEVPPPAAAAAEGSLEMRLEPSRSGNCRAGRLLLPGMGGDVRRGGRGGGWRGGSTSPFLQGRAMALLHGSSPVHPAMNAPHHVPRSSPKKSTIKFTGRILDP